MSPHVNVRPAALRAAAVIVALGTASLTSGCVESALRATDAAADPHARVAPVHYRPVLGAYSGARPVEPSPWIGAPKQEGSH